MPTRAFYTSPRALTGFVNPISFEECRAKYAEHVVLEKRDQVVLCRLHTQGESCRFSPQWYHAMSMLWRDLGADPTNEVLIVTGTGEAWMSGSDPHGSEGFELLTHSYDHYAQAALHLMEGYLYNLDIPTIAAFNGPAPHSEFGLLSDIVICSEESTFGDGHFPGGYVPGDGQTYAIAGRIGLGRASYLAYTGKQIDAAEALRLGLVNEVLTADRLVDRAWELAEAMMQQPRTVRRFTHSLLSRYWKDFLHTHLGYGLALEMMSLHVEGPQST